VAHGAVRAVAADEKSGLLRLLATVRVAQDGGHFVVSVGEANQLGPALDRDAKRREMIGEQVLGVALLQRTIALDLSARLRLVDDAERDSVARELRGEGQTNRARAHHQDDSVHFYPPPD